MSGAGFFWWREVCLALDEGWYWFEVQGISGGRKCVWHDHHHHGHGNYSIHTSVYRSNFFVKLCMRFSFA